MKVLLINVPPGLEAGSNLEPNLTRPPIAYLWIAAILEEHGIEVDIYDALAIGADERKILDYIQKTAPDLVGFTVFTIGVYDVIHICRKIKQLSQGIYTLVGGYHMSVSLEEFINEPALDFACIGEGDHTILELIDALSGKKELKHINGLVFKKDNKVIKNPNRKLRTDMDNIPVLAYEKIIDNEYVPWWSIKSSKKQRYLSTVTGKGCPMNCVWCDIAKTEGVVYRCMSPKRVLKELCYLKYKLGITHLTFDDANFTAHKDRLIEICENIIKEGLGIKWACSSTIVNLDDINVLTLMKKAGCDVIFYGVESGNEEILNKVKRVTKSKVKNVVNMTRKAGIKPHCSFMLGLPGDTKETMDETVNFAIELDPASASFSIAVPYPGTPMYDEYSSKGYIKTKDWRKYENNAVFETENFSAQYLEDLYGIAFRRFYWRSKYILRKLTRIRSLKELLVNVSIGLSLITRKFRKYS